MKCSSCEQEWSGEGMNCVHCGNINGSPGEKQQSQSNNAAAGRKSGRTAHGLDANLIQFPRANAQFTDGSLPVETQPTWRTEVREKVREFRAQRAAVASQEEDLSELNLPGNPIVEAALKRLQRPPEEMLDRSTRPLPKPALNQRPDHKTDRRAEQKAAVEPPTSSNRTLATSAPVTQSSTALAIPEKVLNAEPVLPNATFLDELDDISEARLLPPKSRREEAKTAERSGAAQVNSPEAKPGASRSTPSSKPPTIIIAAEDSVDLYQLPAAMPTRTSSQVSLTERTTAWMCDLVLLILFSIPMIGPGNITGAINEPQRLYAVAAMFVWITFSYYLVTLWAGGRTCGMAWRGMRLETSSGHDQPLSSWRLIIRALGATAATIAPPINWVFIWISGNQSSLSDLASGTIIAPQSGNYDGIGESSTRRG